MSLATLKNSIEFYDQVIAAKSRGDDTSAVGTDHIDWIIDEAHRAVFEIEKWQNYHEHLLKALIKSNLTNINKVIEQHEGFVEYENEIAISS